MLGEPVDEMGPVNAEKRLSHFIASRTVGRSVHHAQMLKRGLKWWTLIEPYLKGGKMGFSGGAGVGKTVLIMN